MRSRTLPCAAAVFAALLTTPVARADYRSDYEALTAGQILSGQDSYFRPIGTPGTVDFMVRDYPGYVPANAVNPGGLRQLIAGEHPGGTGIAAVQRPVSFEFGGRWQVSYDLIALSRGGAQPDATRVGGMTTIPESSAKGFQLGVQWVNVASPNAIRLSWKIHDAAGNRIEAVPPGAPWQSLPAGRWHRVTTLVDFDRNRIEEVRFLNLADGTSDTHRPTQWFLSPPQSPPAPLPSAVRLLVDGGSQSGITLGFDNTRIRNLNVLERRGTLTVYDRGSHKTWLLDANAARNGGVIGYGSDGNAIPSPPKGLLTRAEAQRFAQYISGLSSIPGAQWRLPGTPDGCQDPNELEDLYRAMGNAGAPADTRVFNASVSVSENDYQPPGVTVGANDWQSRREFRMNIQYATLLALLDDPKVVEIDVHEPFVDNRFPFSDLSTTAPYWLSDDGAASPDGRTMWWLGGVSRNAAATLRRFVMLVHEGDVYQTDGEPRPADADGDMIADAVDANTTGASDAFSDGSTTGTIVTRGGQLLSIAPITIGGEDYIRIRSGAHVIDNALANFPSGLQRRGLRLVYDADQDLTWQRDANLASTTGYNSSANTIHGNGRLTWEEASGCGEERGFDTCVTPPAHPQNAAHFLDSLNRSSLSCGNAWRLPGTSGFCGLGLGCDSGEIGYLYSVLLDNPWGRTPGPAPRNRGPFLNIEDGLYWVGQDLYSENSDVRFAFQFGIGNQDSPTKQEGNFAWPVHPGDIGGPDPARIEACNGTVEFVVTRWQAAYAQCGSARVRSERGRVLAIFKPVRGVPAQVRLQPGHELYFDQRSGSLRAAAGNPGPVVVSMDGKTVTLEPGRHVDIDSRPRWIIWFGLLVAALIAWL